MYRAYASDPRARVNLGIRRRLAPLLGNNRRRIELMNGLLFSLPGTPVIYYGDEIGMGDNIYLGDRNGVRTPMQWSRRPQRRLLARQSAAALPAGDHRPGVPLRGDQRRSPAEQPELAVLVDETPDRVAEAVTRPSAAARWSCCSPPIARSWRSCGATRRNACWWWPTCRVLCSTWNWTCPISEHVPVEMFGGRVFPPSATPYPLTLGPHAFYWFLLARQPEKRSLRQFAPGHGLCPSCGRGGLGSVVSAGRENVDSVLPAFLMRRWSLAAADAVTRARLSDAARLESAAGPRFLAFVEFETGPPSAVRR